MDDPILTGTDPLTDLLHGVRGTGAVFHRTSASGAWAARFEDGSPLALTVALYGTAWVVPEGREPVRLGPGDVAVLSGGAPYVIADDPATAPDVVIASGGRCTTVGGEQTSITRGVGAWNAAGPHSTVLLNGLYTTPGGAPGRLLAELPPVAHIAAGQGHCPVSREAFDDLGRPQPGRQVMLDRTLDLMLITALRAWLTRPGAQVPAWYRANSDPVTGHACGCCTPTSPGPWTVENLAAATGVSRAALAGRFTSLVGQPPMTYLREQRIALAADLLREPAVTVHAVAGRVGFSSAFALSAAFKKLRGVSPSQHRASTGSAGG